MPRTGEAGAARELGLRSATALVVGHAIGVGIFLTPADLIGALASPILTLGLWVVGGAMVLAGALTFGELASRFPLAGGPYIYLREAWGERVAFLYGWQSLLVMDPGVTAALTTGASQYLVVLWPAARAPNAGLLCDDLDPGAREHGRLEAQRPGARGHDGVQTPGARRHRRPRVHGG